MKDEDELGRQTVLAAAAPAPKQSNPTAVRKRLFRKKNTVRLVLMTILFGIIEGMSRWYGASLAKKSWEILRHLFGW